MCILGLMKEWFHRKKEFAPNIELIQKVALDLVTRANSGFAPNISAKLAYYAGLPASSLNEFKLNEKSEIGEEVVDIVINNGREKRVAFSLGYGVTSVFFVNKDATKDKMIYKSKKHTEIRNFDELEETIRGFIRLDPKEGEVVDIGRKALDIRMKSHTPRAAALPKIKSERKLNHN